MLIERELERLLGLGFLSVGNSGECPYASSIVVVAKKDGPHRICVDYRQLNQMSNKDAYPLPRLEKILTFLDNADVVF